ncbi:conserved hypothetical protein [Pyrenophora tritici-repentis Pt-1C-BFP]|uniref:Heterokaryon incompatibility domain-containing protein n=1 Tax=Pyrenophora tritici-repentis (strain Pt-1C-BFP) TaxID=426418 RepID=B2WPL8_PYRTR|nr:uncharacterized protein PTRG_11969 [Pyrenophora tritici-repentis Pt-1C-BFP]EDU46084.1 conserved hypothetical protein [Pyrenophora tritici-repentis Pt-1C-BFP]
MSETVDTASVSDDTAIVCLEVPQLRDSTREQAADAEPQSCSSSQAGSTLDLMQQPCRDTPFCGRLITTSLNESPDYVALSYVWGKGSSSDPILHLDGHPLQIRACLWQALEELTTHVNPIRLWVDQICIDQNNEKEKEQQVQLMSRIYAQAQRVIGWLGSHADDSHLAFDLLVMLGQTQHNSEWWRAAHAVMKDGGLKNIFNPTLGPRRATASLVRRPWFYRLWIVQEAALASTLELRCGSSLISGDVFFNAIRILCSAVSDLPMPWLQKPYRNAYKLGQLRAQVRKGQNHSFPHLAYTLSGWLCEKDHDRLIALFGLVFRNNQGWFTPSYSMSGPELYLKFAQAHIRLKESLDILHFAGCGNSDAHTVSENDGRVVLKLNPPSDDIPSWVPDWRVQSRPLTLATSFENEFLGFSATVSEPVFNIDHDKLRVCAREMDKIKVCGLPYCESLWRRIKMTEHALFNSWFSLAKTALLKGADVELMFASTLVMDGKVAVVERQEIGANSPDVPSLFKHWAARNPHDFVGPCKKDWKDGVDDSTRYGYIAEEVCRDRTFFITEAGRLGLGSVHVSPGDSIYLIHGLKTPFVLHRKSGMDILRGECYVYGLMDGKVQHSSEDSVLHLR